MKLLWSIRTILYNLCSRFWAPPSNPPSLAHLAQVCDSTVHGLSIPSSHRKAGKPMKSRTSMKYWNMEILWNYEHLTFYQCAMSVPARKPWFLKLIPNSHVSDPLDIAPLRILAHCSAELFTARRANTSSHAQGNESPFQKKLCTVPWKAGNAPGISSSKSVRFGISAYLHNIMMLYRIL